MAVMLHATFSFMLSLLFRESFPYGDVFRPSIVSDLRCVLNLKSGGKESQYEENFIVLVVEMGSAVPKNRQHGAKNLGCRAEFLCV